MLINPRKENPLRLLQLDLFPPYHFRPARPEKCLDAARAIYTIHVLGLNRRDELTQGREAAYESFRSGIADYIRARDTGVSPDVLDRRINVMSKKTPHRTVLREMQRQHEDISELRMLFVQAPEALHW